MTDDRPPSSPPAPPARPAVPDPVEPAPPDWAPPSAPAEPGPPEWAPPSAPAEPAVPQWSPPEPPPEEAPVPQRPEESPEPSRPDGSPQSPESPETPGSPESPDEPEAPEPAEEPEQPDPTRSGLGSLVTPPDLPPDPPAAEPTGLGEAPLRAALEAVLLVVDEPVAEQVLAEVLAEPVDRVARTLDELSREYTAEGRGFDLRRAAGGWRFYTRAAQAPYVERFVLDGQQARLTQAALETLAVVAYRQPVTRSRVSAVRGVNCDGVIRTLLTRGLIEEVGTEPETGAHLYRTTNVFLEKLGLDSIDELPPLAPFLPDDVTALDPDAPLRGDNGHRRLAGPAAQAEAPDEEGDHGTA